MPRSFRPALALAASCLFPAVSWADEDDPAPLRIEGTAPWGTVTRVMEPEYPREAIARKGKAFIDISGRVTYAGTLEDVVYTPGSPEAAILVEPLREAMKVWGFVVPTDNECQPSAVVVRNRVWFDFDGDRPKLSITRAVREKEAGTLATVKREELLYPDSMLRMGWQANVFTKVSVDPAGNVVKVTATAYPKQRGVNLERFESAAIETMGEWKFAPAPGLARNRHACYEVRYRIKD